MTSRQRAHLDPAINRVRLEKLTIFEITEAELEALERGSPESLYLNLGISALSVSSSFFITLLTTTIGDTRTFCVFVIVTAIGLLSGLTFGLLWWHSRTSLRNVARDIRGRIPPQGDQAPDVPQE
jgi:hypothetical protein